MHTTRMSLAALIIGVLGALGIEAANAAQVEAAFTSAMRYNAAGQLTGTIAPDPDGSGPLRLLATRYTFNQGLLVSVESGQLSGWPDETIAPANWGSYGFLGANVISTREYTYDGYARKITESLKGVNGSVESLIQYSYDSKSRIQCKAVRMNPLAFGALPASACSLGMEGSQGPDRVSRFSYDDFDQVLTEERALGTSVAQTYVINAYSGHLLESQTDANGNLTDLQYDSYGRLFRRLYPSKTAVGTADAADYNEYTYELNGNLRTERKRNGALITYSYDQNNRMTDKVLSDHTYSGDVRYDYDLRGLTLATYFAATPDLGTFNGFDGFGRLESATTTQRVGTATVSRTLGYLHDADGNRTRMTHPDGTYFQYGFDGLNRVNVVSENGADTLLTVVYGIDGKRQDLLRGAGASTNYAFDNAGRLASFTQDFSGTSSDLTNSFAYNPAGQVTQLTQSNSAYTYSGNSNQTGNYAPNGLNQYAILNGQSIAYDANGNLSSDGTLGYIYDMENRLVGSTGTSAGLKYDPLGRLSEIAVIPSPATQFLYDGDALVAEYAVSGNTTILTRRYVHGDRTDEPWVQYNGSGIGSSARRYLHSDHQGTVIAHSDSAGALLTKNAYDAYGIPANTNTDRFGYTGQTWLPELGLNYYKARMYSAKLGRFLQTDPIGYDDDVNLYAYVGNDPLDAVDPSGEDAELHWSAPDQVRLTIRYTVVQQGAKPPFTRQQVQSAVASHYSGTVQVNGKAVTVTAQAIPTSPANAKGKVLNMITVVPNTNGVTQSGRAETNKVGGNSVTVGAAQDTATTVSHELGHTAGAGDQYRGGVDAGGNRLPADVPGPKNIMKDLSGAPANNQTLGEILKAPTNTNTCAKGVSAATGGC